MSMRAVLLDTRELARGAVAALPADASAVVAAYDEYRVALLFYSKSQRNHVRFGVFSGDYSLSADSVDYNKIIAETTQQGTELCDLLTADEAQVSVSGAGQEEDDPCALQAPWSLVWSPNGNLLMISGIIWRGDGKLETAMWIYTRSEWLAMESTEQVVTRPLLLRVNPADYLSAKEWKPLSSLIVAGFFQKDKTNQLFLLSNNGLLIKMDIQVAKICLVAINDASDHAALKGLFQIKVIKHLTEWHAGITAASYEPGSAILVISGGLKNPSDDLVKSHASSLTVWKMTDTKPFCELLDYTMILGEVKASLEVEDSGDADARGITAELSSEDELVKNVKDSIFGPLKFMIGVGNSDVRILHGSIKHLALSADGAYVTMLDDRGRFAIRQIDVCAEVVQWQSIDIALASKEKVCNANMLEMVGKQVEQSFWVGSDVIGFVLANKSVVCAKLHAQKNDYQQIEDEVDDVDLHSSKSSGFIEIIPLRHHVSTIPLAPCNMWMAETVHSFIKQREDGKFYACELMLSEDTWILATMRDVGIALFVDILVKSRHFEEALALVEETGMHEFINLDEIHRKVWIRYRDGAAIILDESSNVFLTNTHDSDSSISFVQALHHLNLVQDKTWVADECLNVIFLDSFANMKELLETGLNSLRTPESSMYEEPRKLDLKRMETLSRYLYRLETLQAMLTKELDEQDETISVEGFYDGAVFAGIRDSSMLDIAKQLAREGRIEALSTVFRRNIWNIVAHRTEILELLPASISPVRYAHLLPAVSSPTDTTDAHFYSLAPVGDQHVGEQFNQDDLEVVEIEFTEENRSHDLQVEEYSIFETAMHWTNDEQVQKYARWFRRRILEMDSLYGQLVSAYQLSCCARISLSEWRNVDDFDQFVQHVERLYKCVYPLQLSTCCLLSLSEWSALSRQEQMMVVIGDVESATSAIDRVHAVFVTQRRNRLNVLDDLFSWLCRTMLADSPSLTSLEFCAQLIHRSNPSIPVRNRWIQGDACLLRTAIDVVFAADASKFLSGTEGKPDSQSSNRHKFIEHLWMIFQSLPVRKDDDPPEIAQLQVEVDEVEDLMVTMDVLIKYGVMASPGELKQNVLSNDSGPQDLLEQICAYGLPGSNLSAKTDQSQEQWMEILRDVVKLKKHVFGERLTQEDILNTILKHMLARDSYFDAIQDLVANWIVSNSEYVDHVMDILLSAIRERLNAVTGNSNIDADNSSQMVAFKYIDIAKHVLTFPAMEEKQARKLHYDEILACEIDLLYACELLDLLSYGAVKVSPAKLRVSNEDERLDIILQVFTSNPSNYKTSKKALDWFQSRQLECHFSHALGAVLHVAKLLHIDSNKLQIVIKGAYSALYCMDYEVAYELAMEAVHKMQTSQFQELRQADTMLRNLISLVFDLVSSSSFRSWTRKILLCSLIFSMNTESSADIFSHPVASMLLACFEKLEAVQSLATELGLSEDDVEERRQQEAQAKCSVDELLLKELEIVIDLLKEQNYDRSFLLRLFQKGFQLLYVTTLEKAAQTFELDVSNRAHDTSYVQQCAKSIQQMSRLCLEESVMLPASGEGRSSKEQGEWKQYLELGFGYLLLWSEICEDDHVFRSFWEEYILPMFLEQQSDSADMTGEVPSRDMIKLFRHFVLFQAASLSQCAVGSGNDAEDLRLRRKKIEMFSYNYESTQRFLSSNYQTDNEYPENDIIFEDDIEVDRRNLTIPSKERYQFYLHVAKLCEDRMVSQQKSEELDEINAFFNDKLDLEAFSNDMEYRKEKILLLATKREHFQLAKEFAIKYGIDEYECLLAYIRNAFLLSSNASRTTSRHEQLDLAFRSDKGDFLEQALQRPFQFGDFLLNGTHNCVYECLDGTDHVGILLLLRMVLECSKRIAQKSDEEIAEQRTPESLLPLEKASVDRITLLFMCLKRLKDIEAADENQQIDFKLVSAATTSIKLMTPPLSNPNANINENRQIAIEAVVPFLSGKTIKVLTKILQKLHQVTPSSIVMIYLNYMLKSIWLEQGSTTTNPLKADLAAYAYESCLPFLSVLTNDHLLLFHGLFLGSGSFNNKEAMLNDPEEFYGQNLCDISHFSTFLSPEKRMELISDALSLLQTRHETWKSSITDSSSTDTALQLSKRSQELHLLEYDLVEAVFWFVVDEARQNNLILEENEHQMNSQDGFNSFEDWEIAIHEWFESSAKNRDSVQELSSDARHLLVELCRWVASVNIGTLLVELVLRLILPYELIKSTIGEVYKDAVKSIVQQHMQESKNSWVDSVIKTWTTDFPSTASIADVNRRVGLLHHAKTIFMSDSSEPNVRSKAQAAVYRRILTQIDQSPSPILKEVVNMRKHLLKQQLKDEKTREPTSQKSIVYDVVVTQWKALVSEYEREHQWFNCAILSYVLTEGQDKIERTSGMKLHFGMRLKAVCEWLMRNNDLETTEDLQLVLNLPSHEIFDKFGTVFEDLLHALQQIAHIQFSQQLTFALGTMIVIHDQVRTGSTKPDGAAASARKQEYKRAITRRIQSQFNLASKDPEAQNPNILSQDYDYHNMCSALLVRGEWDERLLPWYLDHVYDKITDPQAMEDFALAHWEAERNVTLRLILECPFEDLRAAHQDQLLATALDLQRSFGVPYELSELLLLRFDVDVLQQAGLYSSVLNRVMDLKNESTFWSASGEYVVCALVMMKEYTAAGRLVCAVWHVHPLIWDLNNARLILANYLKALAVTPLTPQSDNEEEVLRRQVYKLVYNQYRREITMLDAP